jgi:localization factor PodJL
MKSGVPWQVQVRPEARETAREAARRSGMSVEEWLDTVIIDSASNKGVAPASSARPGHDAQFDRDRQPQQHRQLAASDERHPLPVGDDRRHSELADAISRLDRRLDKVMAEGRSTTLEIAERQRALDGPAPAAAAVHAPTPSESLPRARTQELSGLERELRQINTQIETLSRPCGIDNVVGKAVDTLRDDLAEIGLMLQEAMPRKAVEALEGEVRKLTDRIDHTRQANGDSAAVAGVERGLAEVRDALRALTPAENLVGFDRAVQELSHKIDLIAGNSQDPAALKQLEGAIVAMRGIVSHVASNDALAKLSEEVRSLADKVDHATSGGGSDLLSSLERRIASLADALEAHNRSGHDTPREFETVIQGLIDKIERVPLGHGDHMAFGHLEDRIAKLVDKLDVSDSRLNQLETIERGLAELLIQLEHQRGPQLAGDAVPPPEVDALHRDVADLRQAERKTQDSLEAVHGTLGHVVDRLAMIETGMREKAAQPPAMTAAAAVAEVERPAAPTLRAPAALPAETADEPAEAVAEPNPRVAAADPAKPAAAAAAEWRPIDPNLPPDHPLEPGSSVARGRHPASPADRIAASQAALGPAKPPVIPDPGGKSNFIAAARRAAQAAAADPPARNSARATDPTAGSFKGSKLASFLRGRARVLLVGLGVVAVLLGSLHMALKWFNSPDELAPDRTSLAAPPPPPAGAAPPPTPAVETPPAAAPAKSPSGRQSALVPPLDAAPATATAPDVLLAIETARQAMAGASQKPPTPPAPTREVTGTALQPAKPATAPAPVAAALAAPAQAAAVPPAAAQAPATPPAPAQPAAALSTGSPDKLPTTIGSALRAAVAKGDPTAQFEIAQRYAEGRGMPQNFTEAAAWFERAAKQGLVPAHFRLGGLHEKGLGVKKDLDAARRFYLTAGEAGNAKALHNLAVLYAEGVDGKPDYPTAAKWFRKAAGYGIADSQYNLGILYARGIGVEQNLAEAYKWFALAAREGDTESAKKRDDLGGRLDDRSLKAVHAAVQTWAPEPQPEAATQVKTPPGGWDAAAATSPAPKRKPPVVGPKFDLSISRPAQ